MEFFNVNLYFEKLKEKQGVKISIWEGYEIYDYSKGKESN